jgi:hypothetical protein
MGIFEFDSSQISKLVSLDNAGQMQGITNQALLAKHRVSVFQTANPENSRRQL